VKLKLLLFMSERIGESIDAVITGVEAFGLFVQGIELPAEGLLPRESLPDDAYRYDRRRHTLAGHRAGNSFRLGDRLRVEVASVDLERRTMEFRLEGRHRRPRRAKGPPRGGRRRR
jgi:Exoribonuclease R